MMNTIIIKANNYQTQTDQDQANVMFLALVCIWSIMESDTPDTLSIRINKRVGCLNIH